jgi:hypothetical protein
LACRLGDIVLQGLGQQLASRVYPPDGGTTHESDQTE